MFCPNCGKSDQSFNTYCRQCGEFLPDYSIKKRGFTMGGDTPEEQIRANLILNFLSGMVSLILAILLYANFWNQTGTSAVIYLTAAFLLAMCGWQFSTFRVGLKLKKTFEARKKNDKFELSQSSKSNVFQSAKTAELLNEANFSDVVPPSVTENTTRMLDEKIKRRST
ncbi:MAG: hypothetical protein M3T96_06310 [Acidobacteriota bacterium]|nr:hypothetical protein [Acidobacteriota bacterium]